MPSFPSATAENFPLYSPAASPLACSTFVSNKKNYIAKDSSTATIGFEAKLWLAADKLRNNMNPAELSGARQTATGSPKGERGGVHQFGIPPRSNAKFARALHLILHLVSNR